MTPSAHTRHTGRTLFNESDGIFSANIVLSVTPDGDGWLGLLTVNVQG